MFYSTETIQSFEKEFEDVVLQVDLFCVSLVEQSNLISIKSVNEYIVHGAARRLKVMKRCLSNVFEFYPLTAESPIGMENIEQVQVNLHAFVTNLSGYFDNLAWAFVFRHSLLEMVGGKKNVGLFNKNTQKYLPEKIKEYLQSEKVTKWHEEYLRNYRDALAHRIPLYIPPSALTEPQQERFNALFLEEGDAISRRDWDRLKSIKREQREIGQPFPVFLHSFSEGDSPKPICLHPQMLSDIKTVLDFSPIFLNHWAHHA